MHVTDGAEGSCTAAESWYPELANDDECEKLVTQVRHMPLKRWLLTTLSTLVVVWASATEESLISEALDTVKFFMQVSRSISSTAHKLVERLKWWSTNYLCLLGETEEALKVLLQHSEQPLQLVVASIQQYNDYQGDIQQEESKVNHSSVTDYLRAPKLAKRAQRKFYVLHLPWLTQP